MPPASVAPPPHPGARPGRCSAVVARLRLQRAVAHVGHVQADGGGGEEAAPASTAGWKLVSAMTTTRTRVRLIRVRFREQSWLAGAKKWEGGQGYAATQRQRGGQQAVQPGLILVPGLHPRVVPGLGHVHHNHHLGQQEEGEPKRATQAAERKKKGGVGGVVGDQGKSPKDSELNHPTRGMGDGWSSQSETVRVQVDSAMSGVTARTRQMEAGSKPATISPMLTHSRR